MKGSLFIFNWNSLLFANIYELYNFQDPFQPGNDIARASYGMFYVKDSFKFAYRWLKRAVIAPRKPNEQVFPMTDRFVLFPR